MGLWAKISGKEQKGGNAFVFVFGSDKRFVRRTMGLQGTHLQDNENRMAYFCSPNSNGVLSKNTNGVERTMGPVSIAYEPVPELFSFPLLGWTEDRTKKPRPGGNGDGAIFEEDEILNNSWAEGFSLAAQKQEDVAVRDRLMQILLLAVLGTVAMFLLVASSTGLLKDLISGAGKFFGG